MTLPRPAGGRVIHIEDDLAEHRSRDRRRRLHRLQLRARLDRRDRRIGRQPRRPHLRRQPREPRLARRRPAPPLRPRRHPRPAAARRAAGPAPAARRGPLRRRKPRRPQHPRPGGVREDQHRGQLQPARGDPPALVGPGRGRAQRLSLPPCLDRRGLRLARARRAGLRRDASARAEQPLFGEQGGERPPGAGLAPHLRPAGAHHQLQQQLRALSLPREADPADDRQRPRRQAAAGLRRRHAGARLALRHRPLRRDPRGARRRPRRRDLQHRRLEREAQRRDRRHRLRPARRDAARSGGSVPAPGQACDRPARPRPALRDRRAQDRARARLAAEGDLRDGAAQDGALVSRPRRLGRAGADRRLPRLAVHQLRRPFQRRSGRRGAAAG